MHISFKASEIKDNFQHALHMGPKYSHLRTGDGIGDVVTFLRRTSKPAKTHWFQYPFKLVPKFLREPVARGMETFNKLPGLTKLPSWMKANILFDVVTSTIGATFAAAKTFATTEGGFGDKLQAAAAIGGKKMTKSLVNTALFTVASTAVPVLLGVVGLTTLPGILLGIGGGMVASWVGSKVMDKILPTEPEEIAKAVAPEGAENPQPQTTDPAMDSLKTKMNAFGMSTQANDYVAQMDKDFASARTFAAKTPGSFGYNYKPQS